MELAKSFTYIQEGRNLQVKFVGDPKEASKRCNEMIKIMALKFEVFIISNFPNKNTDGLIGYVIPFKDKIYLTLNNTKQIDDPFPKRLLMIGWLPTKYSSLFCNENCTPIVSNDELYRFFLEDSSRLDNIDINTIVCHNLLKLSNGYDVDTRNKLIRSTSRFYNHEKNVMYLDLARIEYKILHKIELDDADKIFVSRLLMKYLPIHEIHILKMVYFKKPILTLQTDNCEPTSLSKSIAVTLALLIMEQQ